MSSKDPYAILGVSRTATADEIKRAYRKLARQHHPDRNPGNKQAEERFKEVQAAYEVLGDDDRRRQFDQFGAGGPTPDFADWARHAQGPHSRRVDFDFGGQAGAAGFDLSDIIEQFFGRAAAGGRASRRAAQEPQTAAAPLEHTVYVTLEEVLHGTSREVLLQGGGRNGSERIEFRIPPGVTDGQKIRIAGRGHTLRGQRGDLYIIVRVTPHAHLRRDGDNLSADAPISVTDAALGAKVEVQTLDGSAVVTIPPGTSSGARLRLRERGLPNARTGQRGDLLVQVQIRVPKALSPRARELLEELRAELDADAPARTPP